MDAFDRFWQWANKPVDSPLTIPAELHYVVTRLSEEDRGDRRKVNEAVRDALLAQLALWTSPEDIVRLNSELHTLADQIAWDVNKKSPTTARNRPALFTEKGSQTASAGSPNTIRAWRSSTASSAKKATASAAGDDCRESLCATQGRPLVRIWLAGSRTQADRFQRAVGRS
jgi:hypothetical protein